VKYSNPKVKDGVNVSKGHPLGEFFKLLLGVAALIVILKPSSPHASVNPSQKNLPSSRRFRSLLIASSLKWTYLTI